MHLALPLGVLGAGLALAAAVPGQTRPGLIGLTSAPPSILRQSFDCQVERCDPAFPATTLRTAGGTAYDAILGAVWVTNGAVLGAFEARGCRAVCAPRPVPLPATVAATGLAVNERARVMVITDSANVIHQFPLACPLGPRNAGCDVSALLPAGHVLGGVATDDVNDHVLYAASAFTATNPNNVIFVARRGNACQPHCRIPVPNCGTAPLGPITGLAFDPCASVIWATDGVQTVGLRYDAAPPCQATAVQCCRLPPAVAQRFVGLCVEPSSATPEGRSCQNGACPSCPLMAHTAIGDAALGNPAFALELSGAPANAQAWLVVGAGACAPSGPLLPPICGPILVPLRPAPVVVGPVPTGGTVGCTGSALVRVPIPLDRSYCGAVLSSQFLGLCTTGPAFGTFVSNCLGWAVTGT
jgi:hypothetical protein